VVVCSDAQDTYDPRLPELKGLDGKASGGGGSGDKKSAAGGAAGAEADDEDEDDAAPSAAKETALQRGDPLAASNFQKKIETVPVAEMFALAHSDTVAPGSVGEKRNREDVKTVRGVFAGVSLLSTVCVAVVADRGLCDA
jgi:hypothetical protein